MIAGWEVVGWLGRGLCTWRRRTGVLPGLENRSTDGAADLYDCVRPLPDSVRINDVFIFE